MELIEPVEGIGDEERSHLIASVVKDEAVPILVKALARIRVLVEMRAVKIAEAVLIGREVDGTQSRMTPIPAACSASTST